MDTYLQTLNLGSGQETDLGFIAPVVLAVGSSEVDVMVPTSPMGLNVEAYVIVQMESTIARLRA